MSHSVLIKLGPLISTEAMARINNGDPAERFYARGALKLLPREIPLIVDHDMKRQVGVVERLLEFE
ncbi:MAG: hypothetical protein ABIR67_15140, partial [Gaiellaceae bacterium]